MAAGFRLENKLSVLCNRRPPTFHYGVLVAYISGGFSRSRMWKVWLKGENGIQHDVDLHCTYMLFSTLYIHLWAIHRLFHFCISNSNYVWLLNTCVSI